MSTDLSEYRRMAEGGQSLSELQRLFPAQWAALTAELSAVLDAGDADALAAILKRIRAEAESHHARVRKSGGNPAVLAAAMPCMAKLQMSTLWLKSSYLQSMADPSPDHKARLALRDGFIMQRLLFRRDLERKPVSWFWFRWLWPLTRRKQRGLMLYLAQQQGIYCFYSQPLIRRLASMIGGRPCLEIAAGDGTLAGFLKREGEIGRAHV
jgi:hypothetical protein